VADEQKQKTPTWRQWAPVGVIVAFSIVIFFGALGEAPYWDRDEPRNAGCAAEMMARGDWIVPTFNDQIRTQKPVLLYWLMIGAYQLFGTGEFAGRFFSALAAVGTCLLTWHIARSFFNGTTALLAALALCSNLMFCVAARAATPDSILIFFCTAALAFFVGRWSKTSRLPQSSNWESPFESWSCFFGIYTMLGLAVLAKGPVGFLLPMAMMGWFLLQERSAHGRTDTASQGIFTSIVAPFHPRNFLAVLGSMRPLAGVCVVLAISAPWFVLVGLQTDGVFTSRFFLNENFGRATQAFENHSGGLWFYPAAILAGFFPWSMFWGPVIAALCIHRFGKQQSSFPAGIRFGMIWITIQIVTFSIVSTKLPSYVTPCYPALAMITAWVLTRQFSSGQITAPDWLWQLATSAWIASGLGLAAGFVIASRFFPELPAVYGLVGLIPMVSGIFCQVTQKQAGHRYLAGFVGGAVILCFTMFGILSGRVGEQNRFPFAEFLQQHPAASVASFDCLESSWVYYSTHPILELRTDNLEDDRLPGRTQKRKFWQTKERPSANQFASTEGNHFIVTTDESLKQLKEKLPGDATVIQTANWFLNSKKLVLVKVAGPEQVPLEQTSCPSPAPNEHQSQNWSDGIWLQTLMSKTARIRSRCRRGPNRWPTESQATMEFL